MQLTNQGTLESTKPFTEIQINIIENYFPSASISDNTLSFEEEYGDIEYDLYLMIQELKETGAVISGSIIYFGDYDGSYILTDNNIRSLSESETHFYNMSIGEVISLISEFHSTLMPGVLTPTSDICHLAYALYVLDWMEKHAADISERKVSIREYYVSQERSSSNLSFLEYMSALKTSGKWYKDFEDFLEKDFGDISYMHELIASDELLKEYHNYLKDRTDSNNI